MANQKKLGSKRADRTKGEVLPFTPTSNGFANHSGPAYLQGQPVRNSGGYRGKNTLANRKRFNP